MSLLLIGQSINLMLRFSLELAALAIIGIWGFKTGNGPLLKWFLGLGAPLAVALLWSMMGSPKAPIHLAPPLHLVLETVVFGLPILLLVLIGKIDLAWVYGALALANKLLMMLWNQ